MNKGAGSVYSQSPPIAVIPMSGDTVAAVAELERECFSAPWSEKAIAEELHNPRAVFRVALLEGAVAGYAGMHHIVDEGYITNVAVTASARRRGVAAALLEALLNYGRERGLSLITLEVRQSNTGAIALYRNHGFEQVGCRRGYYRNPTEDALLLTRHLRRAE